MTARHGAAPESETMSNEGGMLAQILLKQGEIGTQLAVITEQLKAVPDHEKRIRDLERFRYTVAGVSVFGGMLAGFLGYWAGHLIK